MSEVIFGNSLDHYADWPSPHCIISDGPYGLGIYPGETRDAIDLPAIYEPHVRAWSEAATAETTLWFWNSELGWAETHTLLRQYGWVYEEAVVWDKGAAHLAGKVNSLTVRGVPVTTEICVRYTRQPLIRGQHLRDWLRGEWKRSGLPMREANQACGVRNAATRKWLTRDHLWYAPDSGAVSAMGDYCDQHGDPSGRPYFAGVDVTKLKPRWNHIHGLSNVWQEPAVRGQERIRRAGKTLHPNQKPLSLMRRQIEQSTHPGDTVWEPFGGLFSAGVAAAQLGRDHYGCEINWEFFQAGQDRLAKLDQTG